MKLNKKAIENTILCYWSDEDESYLASSPLFIRTTGSGDSTEEAVNSFKELFALMVDAHEQGNLAGYDNEDRPEETAHLDTRVKHKTFEYIKEQCELFGLSEGEVIDFIVGYAELAILPKKPGTPD